MNLITAALRRPVTVAVIVAALAGVAGLALWRMQIDIFPQLDAPVIYVAQPYGGMSPLEMEGYLVNYYESNFLFISGVERIESHSIQNVGLIRISFHPGTDMSEAAAETNAYINRAMAYMPQGTVPPFVMRYDAGSLPVGDVVLSSATRSQPELDDLALNRVRPLFASLPGVSAPAPFGGNPRSIIVTLNPDALRARRLSPDDVVRAVVAGNAVLPSGNARIGDFNRIVHLNSVVPDYSQLLDLPLHAGPGGDVLLRDVASVDDAADLVSGYAEWNGRRVVYLPVTKHANASTLNVVREIKATLPRMREQVPVDVKVEYAFDQSVYVRDALTTLLIEAGLGAGLTALVVWWFLGERRSALIVAVVIPIALLAAVGGLWGLGQSLNIMTAGGLALAVGILVDEATVTMENIHSHLARGEPLARAVVVSGGEVMGPRILAALCVGAVFLSSLFLQGMSRSLFVPLSLAVGLAMLASLGLSLTLVPVLAVWSGGHTRHEDSRRAQRLWTRLRQVTAGAALRLAAARQLIVPLYLAAALLTAAGLARRMGTDLFPPVNTGEFQLRLRAPAGTRLKRTEVLYQQALALLEREAGAGNVASTLGFVGLQPRAYPVNTIDLWTSGPHEAVVQVALRPDAGVALPALEERLRAAFAREMPQLAISFEAGDLIGRMMNMGSPTPVSVQVSGFDLDADHAYAETVRDTLTRLPRLRDLQYGQPYDYPAVLVDVDRQRASDAGLNVAQIGRTLTEATASSRFVARDFWQSPATGITYQVQVLLPPAEVSSLDAIRNIPLAAATAGGSGTPSRPVLLGDVAQSQLGTVRGEYDHDNLQRMISLTANLHASSLGLAAADIRQALAALPAPPRGVHVDLVGQVQPMEQTLAGLRIGLGLAVVAILLLLTAYFQSWRQALAVLSSVPAVIAGALGFLWLAGSTLNVESYMGIITALGISVANGILLVSQAEVQRRADYADGGNAPEGERRDHAARAGARRGVEGRLRAILMTTSAMVAGMAPMALALEAGGQSAPLGQAVIGGLLASTAATLLLTPAVFVMLMRRRGAQSSSLAEEVG